MSFFVLFVAFYLDQPDTVLINIQSHLEQYSTSYSLTVREESAAGIHRPSFPPLNVRNQH